MNKKFDITVIGAGPAGLSAVRSILKQTHSVTIALIEPQIGSQKNIACAEGCGRLGLHEILDPKPQWIRFFISHAAFHAPDGTRINYTDPNKGYIINRGRMQQDLLEESLNNGITEFFNRRADAVSVPNHDGVRTVTLSDGTAIDSRVILDCSGPLSRIGSGEEISWKPLDLEVAYFAHISNVAVEKDTVHLYVGKELAPGGYAWAFPHDENTFNLGVVVGAPFKGTVNIAHLLDRFIKHRFPQCIVAGFHAGTIPCFNKRSCIAVQGLVKAGDAASTVNPISRAGIVEAMKSGAGAGLCALQMLGADSERSMKKICKTYERAWFDKLGSRHLKLAKVKRSLLQISDGEYNRGAHTLLSIPHTERTMSKIFAVSLGKFPRLVWALRHLM